MIHTSQPSIMFLNAPGRPDSLSYATGIWENALPLPSAQPSHLRGLKLRGLLTTEALERSRARRALVIHRSAAARRVRSGIERKSAVSGVGYVLKDEPVSRFDTYRGSPSGRKLERGDGTPGGRDPPRPEAMPDADDGVVAGEKDDVDREAHEEHVHRAGVVDQHPAVRLEAAAAEEATRSRERAIRDLAALADELPGFGANAREWQGH